MFVRFALQLALTHRAWYGASSSLHARQTRCGSRVGNWQSPSHRGGMSAESREHASQKHLPQ